MTSRVAKNWKKHLSTKFTWFPDGRRMIFTSIVILKIVNIHIVAMAAHAHRTLTLRLRKAAASPRNVFFPGENFFSWGSELVGFRTRQI